MAKNPRLKAVPDGANHQEPEPPDQHQAEIDRQMQITRQKLEERQKRDDLQSEVNSFLANLCGQYPPAHVLGAVAVEYAQLTIEIAQMQVQNLANAVPSIMEQHHNRIKQQNAQAEQHRKEELAKLKQSRPRRK